MKRQILYPAVAVCLLSLGALSCTKEPIDTNSRTQSSTELTIYASMDDDSPMTKTSVVVGENNKKSVLWSEGDAISLFFNSGEDGGSKFVTQDSGVKAKFSGSISSISGDLSELGNTAFFWGLYPYDTNASCDGTAIYTSLSTNQSGIPDTFADNTAVTVGRSENLAIAFKNTNTIFAFKVAHDNIHRVKMYGNNGEKLSGNYSISFDNNGKVVSTPADDAETYISVTPAEGAYFIPDTWYYIVSFPVEFTNGYSMDFETWTDIATYSVSDAKTFKISTFYTLTNKDQGLDFSLNPGNVEIPDPVFKSFCVTNFDTDTDGEISYAEAQAVEEMGAANKGISSLEGIQAFTGLKSLDCSYNELTNIDVSNNTGLLTLICCDQSLKSLNVDNCPSLQILNAGNNQISTLDLSSNPELLELYCDANNLSSLEISKNTKLQTLHCYDNQLTTLDISKNTALEQLLCRKNQLTTIDVSKNTALTSLNCSSNQLTSLDVSANTALTSLNFNINQLTSINVSNNTALTTLHCLGNQLTSIDVSKNTALVILSAAYNQLTSLDVSKNTVLEQLYCQRNQLSTLNVSGCTALWLMRVWDNQLSSLDVSSNTALQQLICNGNQLTSLDLSKNTALSFLNCYSNLLTSLDVSKNSVLESLGCYPMKDQDGANLLQYLYIADGQSISGITENRSSRHIPEETQIVIKGEPGGNDDYEEGGEG